MDSITVGIRQSFDSATVHPVYLGWTNLICHELKLKCKFRQVNGELGTFENGSATGFLGALVNGLFNTTIPFYINTPELREFLDIPQFSFDVYDIFITRKIMDNDANLTSLLSPFSKTVWVVLLLFMVCISVVVILSHDRPVSWLISLAVFLSVFSYLTRKGPKIAVSKLSGNVMLTVWGFGSLLILAAFGSSLMPSLLHKATSPPFTDLISLASCIEQQKCQYVSIPAWFLKELESESATKSMRVLAKVIKDQPKMQLSWVATLKLAINNRDVFYVTGPESRLIFEYSHARDCEKLELIPSEVIVRTTFLFRKEDKLASRFEFVSWRLQQYGLFQAVKQKYPITLVCPTWSEKKSERDGKLSAFSLPLKVISSGFFIVIVGGVAGVFLLLLELFIKNCNTNQSAHSNYNSNSNKSIRVNKTVKIRRKIHRSYSFKRNYWTIKFKKQQIDHY